MKTVFNFHNDMKRSQLEITSDVPSEYIWDYLVPYNNEKLPESVTFKVAAGKKNYDLIRLFQCGEYFFSQKFIDVFSQFMDMSNKCYPINVKGAEVQYYVIYNLKKYPFLNEKTASFEKEPSFYCGKEITMPLFGINNTRRFVVTEEIKKALIKNKISNIWFEESYLCTKKEYKDWKDSQRIAKCRGKE